MTPFGTLWSQVRADWETGAFSQGALAAAHGIDKGTLRNRMRLEGWPERPVADLVQKALPGLVEAASVTDPDSDKVEVLLAAAEGRVVDPDALAEEKASGIAQRKALVLRNHRQASDRYYALALHAVKHLEDYAGGSMTVSFVRARGADGNEFTLPFHLLSKQHGFMDGVQKVGVVLEQAIKLQRHSHGLEQVDGNGQQRKPSAAGALGGLSSKTDDELTRTVSELMSDLRSSGRETPVPPGVIPRA